MPVGLLKAYSRMLPVLTAQEQQADLLIGRVGAGRVKRHVERQLDHDLTRRSRAPGKSKPAHPSELASRGVAVHAVGRPAWADRLVGR